MFNRIVFLFSLFWMMSAYSDIPLATDSRIRTYIYNPNDVYLVIINTGFRKEY